MKSERPNILLICVDQWRGDCLGSAGHHTVQTPYLDQMAVNGVRFASAFSECPSCIAARATIMTGLKPEHTGRIGYMGGVKWDYPTTIAGEFSRNGYHSQAIGKMHVYPERNKIGFDDVILHDGYLHFARKNAGDLTEIDDYIPWLREQTGRVDADYFENGLNCNSYIARPWDKDEYLHPTNFVTARAVDYLYGRRDVEDPFFLFVSYHRPHPPYDPPVWAFEQYLRESMEPPPVGDWSDFVTQWESGTPDAAAACVSPAVLQRARAGYYGHMTHIDHQLNRIFETLMECDKGNTYIMFVSDHGEMMGDHNLFRKCLPYQGSANIPFILKSPQRDEFRRGARIDGGAVGLQDVMPTLLDCAGLPIPDTVDGESLRQTACSGKLSVREFIHGEHNFFEHSLHYMTDGREKYIWWSGDGREQLFDLESDPRELHDLAGKELVRLAIWRRRLVEQLKTRPEGYSDGESLISGRSVRLML